MPPERGSCDAKRARYFYNAERSRCENFGACPVEGEVNNFATRDECLVRCQFSLKNGGVIAAGDTPLVRVGNAATLPIAVAAGSQNVCRMPLDRGDCGRKRARLCVRMSNTRSVGFTLLSGLLSISVSRLRGL